MEICPSRQIFAVVSPHTWLRVKSSPSWCLHVICNEREREETTENTAPEGVRSLLIALQISLQICLFLRRSENFGALTELWNWTSGLSEKHSLCFVFWKLLVQTFTRILLILTKICLYLLEFLQTNTGSVHLTKPGMLTIKTTEIVIKYTNKK